MSFVSNWGITAVCNALPELKALGLWGRNWLPFVPQDCLFTQLHNNLEELIHHWPESLHLSGDCLPQLVVLDMAITLTGINASIEQTVLRVLCLVSAHLVWLGLHLHGKVLTHPVTSWDFLLPAGLYQPLRLQGVLFKDMPVLKTLASSHTPVVADCGPLTNLHRFVSNITSRIRSHYMRRPISVWTDSRGFPACSGGGQGCRGTQPIVGAGQMSFSCRRPRDRTACAQGR